MADKDIDFDDITVNKEGYGPIPKAYQGFSWSNLGALDTHAAFVAGTGYAVSATSGDQVAATLHAKAASVSLSGGSFDVTSVEMTAAFDTKLKVEVLGFKDGEKVYDKTFSISDAHASLLRINASGLDELEFAPLKGKHDPNQTNTGKYFAIDDLMFAHVAGSQTAQAGHEIGMPLGHVSLDLAAAAHHMIA